MESGDTENDHSPAIDSVLLSNGREDLLGHDTSEQSAVNRQTGVNEGFPYGGEARSSSSPYAMSATCTSDQLGSDNVLRQPLPFSMQPNNCVLPCESERFPPSPEPTMRNSTNPVGPVSFSFVASSSLSDG